MGKYTSNKLIVSVFKNKALDNLVYFGYYEWLRDTHPAVWNRYKESHMHDTWMQLVDSFSVILHSIRYGSTTDYLGSRDAILKAVQELFAYGEIRDAKAKDEFKQFSKWLCSGSDITEEIILKRLSTQNFKHGLEELGIAV